MRPGLRPGPRWGSSRRPPDSLVGWGGGNPLPRPHPGPRHLSAPRLSVPSAPRTRRLRHLELSHLPNSSYFPPNLGCLDKTLAITAQSNGERILTSNSAIADKPRDAFRGHVPFHMLGMVSYCSYCIPKTRRFSDIRLQKISLL